MADEMDLRPYAEGDRLPWLETVEPDDRSTPPIGRIVALVLLGLALIAGIVFAIVHFQRSATGGNGQLIAAQDGAYKVKPDEPGGLKVVGEGDSAIATSAGQTGGNGAIDLRAVPEKPVILGHVPAPAATGAATARSTTAPVPQAGGRLVAAAPLTGSRPAGPGTATGGSLVQLGAFPSEGVANAAWTTFSKRFAYLAPLAKSIQPVARGGQTLYRLRVDAGSANQAADICGRLRVAGETCFVAS